MDSFHVIAWTEKHNCHRYFSIMLIQWGTVNDKKLEKDVVWFGVVSLFGLLLKKLTQLVF